MGTETILLIVAIVLLVVLIALVLVVALKKKDQTSEINEDAIKYLLATENAKIKEDIIKMIMESSKENQGDLNTFREKVIEKLNENLTSMNEKVNASLVEGFKDNQKTFTNVTERLAIIDEAQKKMDKLSKDVLDLNSVLTNKNTRGRLGELQLNQILETVFGDNKVLYDTQKKLSTGDKPDAVVFAPKPLNTIAIDSKFPLNAYENLIVDIKDKKLQSAFVSAVKKHIDDISRKYIIHGETSEFALMFIPSEAIFSDMINHFYSEIVDYAYEKNVWITSGTTLVAILTLINVTVTNMRRDEQAEVILDELKALAIEFERYRKRWEEFGKTIDKVVDNAKDISVTSDKISKRFDDIQAGKIDLKDKEIEDEN